MKACKVPKCARVKEALGLCMHHYRCFKKYGAFESPKQKQRDEDLAAIERLLKNAKRTAN